MKESNGLIEAVEAGDLQTVRKLLDQGADTEASDDNGMTPLHHAAYRGHRDIVAALVSSGADIHARDRFGGTPLLHAVVDDHESIAIYLLMNGADPQAASDQWSPIELALFTRHDRLALLLELASHADLKYVRRLARSLASSPSNPSENADRLVITRLLEDKGLDTQFEPLLTAFLHEIRSERPKPMYNSRSRPVTSADRGHPAAQGSVPLTSRRAARFIGAPPESLGTGRSWTVSGSDDSVLAGEVDNFEESAMAMYINEGGQFRQITRGDFDSIIDKAVEELHYIVFEDSSRALDLFNRYYRRINEAFPDHPFLQRTLRTALMLYTDDRFFRVLNDRWRNNRSREMIGFSTLMSMAFRDAPYYMSGEVYRGVDLADVEHYQPGLVFRWPFFISASKNPDVAARFGKTLVVIEVPGDANVREISYCSLFPEEGEVLFRAYEIFEVLEASPSEVRIRVFYDDWFGTGWEIGEHGVVREID